MSDDTEPKALFDSTLKKKKKKKTKKAVDDDEGVENVPENESEEKAEPQAKPAKKKKAKSKAETEEPEPEDQTEAAAPLKKKKKKKKAFSPSEENEDETAETESKQTEDAPSKSKKTAKKQDADDQADDSFSLPEKKKKTKKKGVRFEGDAKEEEPENNDEADNNRDDVDDVEEDDDDDEDQLVDFGKKKKKKNSKEGSPWSDSDRDYLYTELLERIFSLLNENNPELVKSKKTKYVIKPPEVLREGTKKTVWANFQEICDAMHRQSDHVLAYAQTELGTTASIDGNQRLVIKGRFQPKQIEIVVRHYIAEYVSCRTCKSPDTLLKKENRLYFLQCKSCGSTRTVASIKQGFVAQVGKRKHN